MNSKCAAAVAVVLFTGAQAVAQVPPYIEKRIQQFRQHQAATKAQVEAVRKQFEVLEVQWAADLVRRKAEAETLASAVAKKRAEVKRLAEKLEAERDELTEMIARLRVAEDHIKTATPKPAKTPVDQETPGRRGNKAGKENGVAP